MSDEPKIPLLDLGPETEALWGELKVGIERVLRSGLFILGPEVEALETEVASFLGVAHAVGLNSGTDALVLGLRALGVGPGDEVITSPFTFFATAEAISQVGAIPVFVDIDPATFNLDPEQVAGAVSERTAAILPVHLFGQAADMDAILETARARGCRVLEDVAQAFGGTHRGRKLGTLGDAGAFSFFPSKNLGACGDAGLLATDDPEVADVVRRLRAHGARTKYYNEEIGYNSRLDALQAAILRVKLPRLEAANAKRREAAARYRELLAGVPAAVVPEEVAYAGHVYHQFTVRLPAARRDEVRRELAAAGIATMVYYPTPVHRLPVYSGLGYRLPVAEAAAKEVLSLPLWPQIEPAIQERVVRCLGRALG